MLISKSPRRLKVKKTKKTKIEKKTKHQTRGLLRINRKKQPRVEDSCVVDHGMQRTIAILKMRR